MALLYIYNTIISTILLFKHCYKKLGFPIQQKLSLFPLLLAASFVKFVWNNVESYHPDYIIILSSVHICYPFHLLLLLNLQKWIDFCYLFVILLVPVSDIWRRWPSLITTGILLLKQFSYTISIFIIKLTGCNSNQT